MSEKDSAVESVSIIQRGNQTAVAVVQFKQGKNFWEDSSWTPRYKELAFIMKKISEAEEFNRDKSEDPNISYVDWRDINTALDEFRIAEIRGKPPIGWKRIGDYYYRLIGEDIIIRKPV